jgi:transposase
MACDALGYPRGFILTGANVSDFDQAKPLLQRYLKPGANSIMDKGEDCDAIRDFIRQRGGIAVIPPKANRSIKPVFDEHIYVERHHIENLFARLKSFHRIATRYEKPPRTFAAMASIDFIWIKPLALFSRHALGLVAQKKGPVLRRGLFS